jgi:hypothetical protein
MIGLKASGHGGRSDHFILVIVVLDVLVELSWDPGFGGIRVMRYAVFVFVCFGQQGGIELVLISTSLLAHWCPVGIVERFIHG